MGEDIVFLIILVFLVGVVSVIVGILAIVALAKIASLRNELRLLRTELQDVQRRQAETHIPSPAIPRMPSAPVPPIEKRSPAEVPTAPAAAAPPPPVMRPAPTVTRQPSPPSHVPAAASSQGMSADGGLQNLESKIGQRWIAWVGAVVVFFSAVFFLKLAFENNWIGPTGQVAICALIGMCMLAGGSRFVGKGWRILGQCLMGLGLGILYATFYSAFSVYEIPVMSQSAAFGFMVIVTIVGMTLAIMHDAVSMAFLAVLGGILTPVLVSTGQDSRDVLFSYLIILDLGVLGVAFFRGWRLLDTLAMIGTVILYAGWYGKFYTPEGMGPALAWLGAFYIVFLVLPFVYHLVRKQEVTIERFVMALGNALFAAAYAWWTLHTDYLFTMGFVALGMAAAYLVLGALLRRRVPNDTRALFGMIAMTVTFLTLAVPMQLRSHGILLAWVAEAPVLAYLAYRFRYLPVRVFGAAILLVAVGRLFFSEVHWPLHAELFVPFFNARFGSAMTVPLAAALYAWIHHLYKNEATALDRALKVAAALGSGFLTLIILHAETWHWLNNDFGTYPADSAVATLWAVGAFAYLWSGNKANRAASWVWAVGMLALIISTILSMAGFNEDMGHGHVMFANARFAAAFLVPLGLLCYAWLIGRGAKSTDSPANMLAILLLVVGIIGLLILLSTEVFTYCVDVITERTSALRAGQMSITLVWSLYAAALLSVGFWRRWRSLRLAGLALFGLAALKLVLMDLTFLKDVYRIVSFLVLGVLMLTASYVYHRLEKRLAGARQSAAPEGGQPATGETK